LKNPIDIFKLINKRWELILIFFKMY
jgi:hypothetical protein